MCMRAGQRRRVYPLLSQAMHVADHFTVLSQHGPVRETRCGRSRVLPFMAPGLSETSAHRKYTSIKTDRYSISISRQSHSPGLGRACLCQVLPLMHVGVRSYPGHVPRPVRALTKPVIPQEQLEELDDLPAGATLVPVGWSSERAQRWAVQCVHHQLAMYATAVSAAGLMSNPSL